MRPAAPSDFLTFIEQVQRSLELGHVLHAYVLVHAAGKLVQPAVIDIAHFSDPEVISPVCPKAAAHGLDMLFKIHAAKSIRKMPRLQADNCLRYKI